MAAFNSCFITAPLDAAEVTLSRAAAATMESRVAHRIHGGGSSILTQPLLEVRGPYSRLQPQQPLTVYRIDQIRLSHQENDYIDSPSVVSQQPSSHKGASRRSTWLGHSQESFSVGGNNNHQQQQQQARCEGAPFPHQDATTHPWISFSGRPCSVSSSSSTSSDQQLLDHTTPPPNLDQQPTPGCFTSSTSTSKVFTSSDPCSTSSMSKVLTSSTCSSSSSSTSSSTKDSNRTAKVASSHQRVPLPLPLLPSSPAEKKHLLLCEHCGRCRCGECTLPRPLPSCWVCNQEWLCSAQSLVDGATCMCLVRGVFYHCAADDQDDHEGDEGSCAERPCSCSGPHCCARWSFMAAMSLLLPCLLCYLPASGATLLGQRCYDRLSRPGCRCRSSSQGGSSRGFLLLQGGDKGGALEKQQQQREGA